MYIIIFMVTEFLNQLPLLTLYWRRKKIVCTIHGKCHSYILLNPALGEPKHSIHLPVLLHFPSRALNQLFVYSCVLNSWISPCLTCISALQEEDQTPCLSGLTLKRGFIFSPQTFWMTSPWDLIPSKAGWSGL